MEYLGRNPLVAHCIAAALAAVGRLAAGCSLAADFAAVAADCKPAAVALVVALAAVALAVLALAVGCSSVVALAVGPAVELARRLALTLAFA